MKKSQVANVVHITSGEFRGRELKTPGIADTHPMGSRERLALFNSLGPAISGAVVLDAFAGTGALGFEALSRGATHVTFVEKNHKAATAIRENVATFGLDARASLYESKIESISFDQKFDVVFADPPYNFFNNLPGVGRISIATLNRLAQSAGKIFVLSHPATFDPHVINAPLKSTRSYASARISIFVM